MGRAEIRRIQKAAQRKQNTYTLTQSQIEQLKQVAYKEAVAEAMKLMLTIPLEVLAKDYWPRSAEKRSWVWEFPFRESWTRNIRGSFSPMC